MRRLLVSLVTVAALVLPVSAALASDGPAAGVSGCPYPQKGVGIWHYDAKSGYTYVWACI